MEARRKIWVSIGVFALVGAAPVALGGMSPFSLEGAWAAEGEGGEAGEAGESGEGGIDAERAKTDPKEYLTAIDVMKAHYLAGRDAYAAGETMAAAEMFAHPISEVYLDLEPVLQARGVAPFQDAMVSTADLASQKSPAAQVGKAADGVIAKLDAAALKAPPAPISRAALEAKLIIEMIDRAALQYGQAAKGTEYEPYLDGYGFYKAANARAAKTLSAIKTADAGIATQIGEMLGLLGKAYPSAKRGATTADPAQLIARASSLKLDANRLR